MTAEQWIETNIPQKIEGDSIRLDENQTVPITTFCTFFRDSLESDAVGEDMYLSLIGEHTFLWGGNQVTYTGEQLGYKPTFDAWKAEGVFEEGGVA